MVSHKYKCIFVHLPKTGGEAISSLFEDCDPNIPKHANAIQIKEYLGEKTWNEYFKFAIVRNPFDQVLSMYSHLRKSLYQKEVIRKKYGKTIINPVNACSTAINCSFPKYCESVIKVEQHQVEMERKYWPVNHFAPFLDWISDANGNIIIDYIGKFENLSNEIEIIFNKINKPVVHIPQRNQSKHKHYSLYYNQTSIDTVSKHYQKDIKYFGYQFNDERTVFQKLLNALI